MTGSGVQDDSVVPVVVQGDRCAGLMQVLILLQERFYMTGSGVQDDPVVPVVAQADSYAIDRTLAVLGDLGSQLKNQRMNTEKDLRKPHKDEQKRVMLVTTKQRKFTRSEALQDGHGVDLSDEDTHGDFKERLKSIKCFRCHRLDTLLLTATAGVLGDRSVRWMRRSRRKPRQGV
ncbi:hypothetical protein SARC_03372 [Sphaeroforma arctica JP610]|uniref:Uncharacterized protein n=1 Tax=Sphaeroforma arctica JP610 TaxID=667725 RepID=A0A0L0G5V7_9EUKA|nr:hypothetical protein SARC_03372 [Sphaeroforma arctica JP610]KNC84410.1 hypothetical protein SARC_03372 [Sphaeroforma arctica JP610]|eukprot:XP_014158312.1 hypothetical protein SARC_03372 [Sphaeroforma arctica JP610]